MTEILQDYQTFDSLQTQYNQNQKLAREKLSDIVQNSSNIASDTLPLAQQNPDRSPVTSDAPSKPQQQLPTRYAKLNFAGDYNDPMYDTSSEVSTTTDLDKFSFAEESYSKTSQPCQAQKEDQPPIPIQTNDPPQTPRASTDQEQNRHGHIPTVLLSPSRTLLRHAPSHSTIKKKQTKI